MTFQTMSWKHKQCKLFGKTWTVRMQLTERLQPWQHSWPLVLKSPKQSDLHVAFYHNIFCILFDIKNSIYFVLWNFLCVTWDICMCRCVQHLYLSAWNVTKHGGWSLSPMGVNWVSDGVSIDSTEYMHCKGVHFSGSLKWTTVIDFWGRNRVIPVKTKLLLLSNRLQGFWWDRTILN